jgi:hypothetical protein
MNPKTKEKLEKIMAFHKTLEVSVEALQKIDENGFIRQVVFYNDLEKYPEEVKPTQDVTPSQVNTK